MRESVQPHEEKLKGNGPVPSSAGPAALPSQEFVPSRQPESPVGRGLEPATVESPEDPETFARLLRAVESTSVAQQFQGSKLKDAADRKSSPAFSTKGSKSAAPLLQEKSSLAQRLEPSPAETVKNNETLSRLLRSAEETNSDTLPQSPKLEHVADPGSARAWLDEETPAAAPTFASLLINRLSPGPKPAPVPPPAPPQAAKATAAKPGGRVCAELPTRNVIGAAPVPPAQIPPPVQSQQAAQPITPEPPKAEHVDPGAPQYAVPLFLVSKKRQGYVVVEEDSSSISPPSSCVSDAIDSAPESSPFKPPAPVEGLKPFLASLDSHVRRLGSKIGVPASFWDRLNRFASRLFGEPIEETQGPVDPRRNPRLFNPPLVALFWTGGPPKPHRIADISSTGLYLLVRAAWSPGTRLSMTLRRTDRAFESQGSWLITDYLVVRRGSDGFGGVFIPYLPGSTARMAGTAEGVSATKLDLQRFMDHLMIADPECKTDMK